ncbi:MAG: hypothetical protein K2X29_12440, partial [Candidatus Obscuribacterales bacterium]|nr:hypothetical protein [Candidatus Obscuribacterales bacterium]
MAILKKPGLSSRTLFAKTKHRDKSLERARSKEALRTFLFGTTAGAVLLAQCYPLAAFADGGSPVPVTNLPGKLNLSSTARFVPAPSDLQAPVTISNGSKQQQVQPGALLTPAQFVAMQQVLQTGTQSILLNSMGGAVGGSVAIASQKLSTLIVPQGVTVYGDFTGGSSLAVTGNLTNSGSIFALSNTSAVTNAVISATNIRNFTGGLISSVLPSGVSSTATSDLSLTLMATQSIINRGTISSAANLNLVGSGSNFVIDSVGGTMTAANAINITGAGTANSVLNVLGGNWFSPVMNINSGLGNAIANLNQVTSVVNIHGCNAHVYAATENLILGELDILNDPVFFNVGNITVTAAPSNFSEALAIIATGDIDLGNFNYNTNNGGANAKGFPITIVAGIIPTPPIATPPSVNPNLGPAVTSGSVKWSSGGGPSATGGNIQCAGCTIDSSSTGSNPGGNILIAAYGGTVSNGLVDLTGSTINSSSNTGAAGSVTVIAPFGITLNTVNANGGSTGNKIILSVAAPTGSVTVDIKGNPSGTLTPGTLGSGALQLSGAITAPSAIFSATTGTGNLTVDGLINVAGLAGSGKA